MHRCIELARKGGGWVYPNPMVGAVLVYGDRIIGEGYHRKYGEAHAEVHAIHSVSEADQHLIPASTLFVSLEPCAHYGKTPPCADLIISKRIPKCVVGCRDPFRQVDGRGIEKLRHAGVEVMLFVLEKECRDLNKRFFCFHKKQRPWVLLKWATSSDGYIAGESPERIQISSPASNRLVHQWRSEEAAILVGRNTAAKDDPVLNARFGFAPDPVRIVLDSKLTLSPQLHVFDGTQPTMVVNEMKEDTTGKLEWIREDTGNILQILQRLYQRNILSVMVEGGQKVLQSFIDAGLWDEARIITNEKLFLEKGTESPGLTNARLIKEEWIDSDRIRYFSPAG